MADEEGAWIDAEEDRDAKWLAGCTGTGTSMRKKKASAELGIEWANRQLVKSEEKQVEVVGSGERKRRLVQKWWCGDGGCKAKKEVKNDLVGSD